ncbi:hypothetical protein OSTOST_20498 [Ostertagia ostertagi]
MHHYHFNWHDYGGTVSKINFKENKIYQCAAFKKDMVRHSTVVRRFVSDYISIKGQERPGRPLTLKMMIRSALISNPNITARVLATALRCSKATVSNRLASLRFRKIVSCEFRETDRAVVSEFLSHCFFVRTGRICWWNCDGMRYYKFLESGTTVRVNMYSNQLQKVTDTILHNYPKQLQNYLLHDNSPSSGNRS